MKTSKLLFLLTVLSLGVLSSCKQDIPTPDPYPIVDMKVSATISELLKMGPASGNSSFVLLDSVANKENPTGARLPIIIKGVITSTDQEGNIYQYLTVQDATAAIKISIEMKGIFNQYTLGQQIYIKCTGMHMGRYGDMIQLGATYEADESDGSKITKIGRLPAARINNHLFKTDRPSAANLPKPLEIKSMTQLHDSILGCLVIFKGVKFAKPGYVWAPNINKTGTSPENMLREFAFSEGAAATIKIGTYTSEYATFATLPVPAGQGDVIGIMTMYKTSSATWQLILRNKEDYINGGFTSASVIDPVEILAKATPYDLSAVRDDLPKYPNTFTYKDTNKKIKGVVISDGSDGNSNIVSNRAIYIQDTKGFGINIFFTNPHPYVLGDEIEVLLDGSNLIEYYGVTELEGTDLEHTNRVTQGRIIDPTVATITEIKANVNKYESTLVTIKNVLVTHTASKVFLAGGSAANHLITDAAGNTMVMRISGKLPYASNIVGKTIPTYRVDMTGIIGGLDKDPQIVFRNMGDLVEAK